MRVSSCCGCCSLKAGVYIIGTLNLIGSIITIIVWAVQSVDYVASFVIPVVHLVCAVLLIIGARNGNSRFIFPTLCLFFTNLILILPFISIYTMERAVAVHEKPMFYVLSMFILGLIFGLSTYFFLVIDTFFKELLSENDPASRMNKHVVVEFPPTLNPEQT